MLALACACAALVADGHLSEGAGLSPTGGSHPAKHRSTSPEQKDLHLRMQQNHIVDIIISDRDHFVFVDNVKAASTTVRELLGEKLNVSWWDGCDGAYRRCCSTLGRTTSACLNERHASYFVFGFARHPAVKFESGAPAAGRVFAYGSTSHVGPPPISAPISAPTDLGRSLSLQLCWLGASSPRPSRRELFLSTNRCARGLGAVEGARSVFR